MTNNEGTLHTLTGTINYGNEIGSFDFYFDILKKWSKEICIFFQVFQQTRL